MESVQPDDVNQQKISQFLLLFLVSRQHLFRLQPRCANELD